MRKMPLVVLIVFMVILIFTGCSIKTKTDKQINAGIQNQQPGKDPNTVTFAYIAMPQTSPQALINKKFDILGTELKKLGKTVNFVSTRSLDNIWPMMDKVQGGPEFVYIPSANFATYITETSRFGGSNNYAIIAGSSNGNSTVLIVRPEIKSLKDLAGKKVGAANLRYSDEFQLNQVLAAQGLATKTMGGTVQTLYDDIVLTELENFKNGKYDGIVLYGPENFSAALKSVPGSKILTTLNPNGLFGKQQPRTWLVARKDLIKDNPKLVKQVLKAHLLLTEKALANAGEIPALNREQYLLYFKEKNTVMDDILRKHTLEFYKKNWKEAEITYDPNMKFVTDVFNFMARKGVVKGKTIDDFVQMDLFNEVLKENGKPEIK